MIFLHQVLLHWLRVNGIQLIQATYIIQFRIGIDRTLINEKIYFRHKENYLISTGNVVLDFSQCIIANWIVNVKIDKLT